MWQEDGPFPEIAQTLSFRKAHIKKRNVLQTEKPKTQLFQGAKAALLNEEKLSCGRNL